MSTSLSIPQELHAAFLELLSDRARTNWVMYGYDKGQNVLKMVESGEGGLDELEQEFDDNKILYAFARVIEPISRLPKLVLISWCGDGAPTEKKGLYSFHVQEVQRFFQGIHMHINARNEADVEPCNIIKKLKDGTGAKYAIHQHGKARETEVVKSVPPPRPEKHIAPYQASISAPKPFVPSTETAKPSYPYQPPTESVKAPATQVTYATKPSFPAQAAYPIGVSSSGSGYAAPSIPKPAVPVAMNKPRQQDDAHAILQKQREQDLQMALQREKEERERFEQQERERFAALRIEDKMDIRQQRLEQERLEREREAARLKKQGQENRGMMSSRDEAGDIRQQRLEQEKLEREREDARLKQQGVKVVPAMQESSDKMDIRQQRLEQEKLERQREAERLKKQGMNNDVPGAFGQGATDRMDIRQQRLEQERLEREREEKRLKNLKAEQEKSSQEAQEKHRQFESQGGPSRMYSGASVVQTSAPVPVSTAPVYHTPPAVLQSTTSFAPVPVKREDEEEMRRKEQEAEQRRRREQEETEQRRRQEQEAEQRRREQEEAEQRRKQASSKNASSAGLTAVVLYDYEPAEDNEIPLVEGSRITEIQQLDEGWWSGKDAEGRVGLFPANYVELVEEAAVSVPVQAPMHVPVSAPAPVPVPVAAPVNPPAPPKARVKAQYDYDAAEDNEISFAENDIIEEVEFVSEEWWQGRVHGRVGLFPANYVELL